MLTIPAFFLLARTVLKSPVKAGLATVAFALVPSSMDILLWGGGVTRGLGFLFCILASRQLMFLFQNKQWKSVIAASILSALVVLSHPSAAFVTVLFAGVFWLWYGRNLRSAAQAAAVGGLVLVLTLPWWLPVVQNHGLQPFRAGLGSGWFTNVFIPFITLNTTQEPFLTIVMVIAVIGLLHSLYRKQFLLPLWLFASLLSQRDGYIYATLPVCLLFSNVLVDLVCPAMALIHRRDEDCSTAVFTGGARWLVSFFLVYSLINAVYAAETVRPIRVTPAEREAMDWVMDNSPTNARFLMLTFGDPLNTPFQEWFPAITKRINLTTVQGYEWLPDSLFVRRMESFKSLQPCMTGSYDCVEEWANQHHLVFDYLLVHHSYVGRLTIGEGDAKVNQWISASLNEAPAYQRVYQSENIEIFKRNTNSAYSSP